MWKKFKITAPYCTAGCWAWITAEGSFATTGNQAFPLCNNNARQTFPNCGGGVWGGKSMEHHSTTLRGKPFHIAVEECEVERLWSSIEAALYNNTARQAFPMLRRSVRLRAWSTLEGAFATTLLAKLFQLWSCVSWRVWGTTEGDLCNNNARQTSSCGGGVWESLWSTTDGRSLLQHWQASFFLHFITMLQVSLMVLYRCWFSAYSKFIRIC